MLKKVVVLGVVLFVLYSAFQSQKMIDGGDVSNNNKSESKENIIKTILSSINTKAPVMIDQEIRLNKVYMKKDDMVLDYTLINFDPGEITDKKFREVMYEDIISFSCNTKQFSDVLDHGIKFISIYKDNKDNTISEIPISSSICTQYGKQNS